MSNPSYSILSSIYTNLKTTHDKEIENSFKMQREKKWIGSGEIQTNIGKANN